MNEILKILLPYNYVPTDLLLDITRYFKVSYTSNNIIQLDNTYSNKFYYKTFLCLKNKWLYIGEMEADINKLIQKGEN